MWKILLSMGLLGAVGSAAAQSRVADAPSFVERYQGMPWRLTVEHSSRLAAQYTVAKSGRFVGIIRFDQPPASVDEVNADLAERQRIAAGGLRDPSDFASLEAISRREEARARSISGEISGDVTSDFNLVGLMALQLRCEPIRITEPERLRIHGYYTADGFTLFGRGRDQRLIPARCVTATPVGPKPHPYPVVNPPPGAVGLGTWGALRWQAGPQTIRLPGAALGELYTDVVTLEPACDVPLPPSAVRRSTVRIDVSTPINTVVDNTLTIAQISSENPRAELIKGLTKPFWDVDLPSGPDPQPARFGDGVCSRIDLSRAALRFKLTAKVHIAAEYAPGTCPYKVTLAHERRHAAAYEQVWHEFAPRFADAIASSGLPMPGQQWWAKDRTDFWNKLKAHLAEVIQSVEVSLNQRSDELNGVIDLPEAQARERRQCPESQWNAGRL